MKTIKTLIIYNIIPEETILAIVDLSSEEFDKYSIVAGQTVNVDDISDEHLQVHLDIGDNLLEGGEWFHYRLPLNTLNLEGSFKTIYVGWIL